MSISKPKLNYHDQLEHLKTKGITFISMNETEAIAYLIENNNLFKLSSYRKNFNKDITNSRYLSLDFSYLVDLAVIDTRLRMLMLEIALSIEHFAKVKLLKRITLSTNEDGYTIVQDFYQQLRTDNERSYLHLMNEISRSQQSIYCGDIYQKYSNNIPVWAFLELLTFGSFISFYKFCADRFLSCDQDKYLKEQDKKMLDEFYMLLDVKHIRNASAHNNCILNNLKTKTKKIKKRSNLSLTRALSEIGISATTRSRKLSNERISQILTCLYLLKCIVHSEGTIKYFTWSLHEFTSRLFRNNNYNDNLLIKSTFDVLTLAIDKWFPLK